MDIKSEIERVIEAENNKFTEKCAKLQEIFKAHEKEVTKLKGEKPEIFERLVIKIQEIVQNEDIDELLKILPTFISNDPYIFKENVYKITVECMLREKSFGSSSDYELLLENVIKIFAKDVNQFLRKLLKAIDEKLESFSMPKKKKRKHKRDVEVPTKKFKLVDGNSVSIISSNISNNWPAKAVQQFDDIISRLNVSQTLSLWKTLNDALLRMLDEIKLEVNENLLFKLDFISTFLCQLFRCSRIHEQLVYKKLEISSAIHEFNEVQHKFYEVIFNVEYNNRIMNAFLKISYDYENFLMLYFYHYEGDCDLDSVFLTDKSKLKSSDWKIIQQRIRNFGKSEEKNYSNLLVIQQIIKSKLFDSNVDIDKEFLTNLLTDNEQMDLLMSRREARVILVGLLNNKLHFSLFIEYLCLHVVDDEYIATILSLLSKPSSIDGFVGEILKSSDNDKALKLLKILPLSTVSNENKKLILKTLQDIASEEEFHDTIIQVLLKIFKTDSYKNLFADFSMKHIAKKFKNVSKFSHVYETIFKNFLKRMNMEIMQQMKWIVESDNEELFMIFAKVLSETNLRNVSVSGDPLNEFQMKVISKLSLMVKESELENIFVVFSKLCIQNINIISENIKEKHIKLLQKYLKLARSSPNAHSSELFKMTLRDSKKLNLNDELKSDIVKALVKCLNTTIEENVKNIEILKRVDTEKELISLLTSFKSNCRLECAQFMHDFMANVGTITNVQLIYCFKIFEVLLEHSDKQNSKKLVEKFINFYYKFVLMRGKVTDADLLSTIFNAFNEMIKSNKDYVDSEIMDDAWMFLIDQGNRPNSESVEDFCKFYEAVGQFLYLVGNSQPQYFKSRVPQYFGVYRKYVEDIYLFRNESDVDITPKEISMMQRLTLQLENVMKMLVKNHASAISVIVPYTVSSIINVFMKNPKLLTLGDKFKMNIKNICYQLLKILDDRARKHIYAVVDEATKDFYEDLFKDLKRRT